MLKPINRLRIPQKIYKNESVIIMGCGWNDKKSSVNSTSVLKAKLKPLVWTLRPCWQRAIHLCLTVTYLVTGRVMLLFPETIFHSQSNQICKETIAYYQNVTVKTTDSIRRVYFLVFLLKVAYMPSSKLSSN